MVYIRCTGGSLHMLEGEQAADLQLQTAAIMCSLGEPSNWICRKIWSFVPTRSPPPPHPRKLRHPKLKEKNWCFFCISGYSKHIMFSWKISFFWLGQWIIRNWGVQDPHELIRYCSPIYVLCVSSHFWPFTKANLVLENFNKNLGFGQTPPPLVGPNAQLFPKMHFEGPPYTFIILFSLLSQYFLCPN